MNEPTRIEILICLARSSGYSFDMLERACRGLDAKGFRIWVENMKALTASCRAGEVPVRRPEGLSYRLSAHRTH